MVSSRVGVLVVVCLVLASPVGAAEPMGRTDLFGDPLPEKAVARLGTVRFRHGQLITSVSFSADSKLLASAGQDGTVRVWDAATGQLQQAFNAETKDGVAATFRAVNSVALSPDGKTVAASSNDGLVRAWQVGGGKQLFEMTPGAVVGSVTFAPDGKTLALGVANGQVYLLERDTGKQLRQWFAHQNPIGQLSFSPDGTDLTTLGRDGSLRTWDPATGREVRPLSGPQLNFGGNANALAYSADGKLLASSDAFKARVWEAATGKELHAFDVPNTGLSGVAFDPKGKLLYAAGTSDPRVRVWDLAQGKVVREIERPDGLVQQAALSPDGKVLALVGDRRTVLLYDAEKGQRLEHAAAHEGMISHLAFSSDGRSLVTGSWDHTVRIWKGSGEQQQVRDVTGRVLAMTGDGQRVATAAGDGVITILEPATGKELQKLTGHQGQPLLCLFSRDGKQLFTGGGPDQTLRLWDVTAGQELRQFAEAGPNLRTYTVTPEGRTLVTVDTNGVLRWWEMATGKLLRESSEPMGLVITLRFSPDGSYLAAGYNDGTVRFWETVTGKKSAEMSGLLGQLMSVAFLPDGRTLLTGGWGAVRAPWDLATGRERGQLMGHQGEVSRLIVSPDGKLLATASYDTTALLWDLGALPPAPASTELTPRELDALWADLGTDDSAKAYQAVRKLSGDLKRSAPYLAGKLQPVTDPDPKRVAVLIDDLAADGLVVRQTASAELERLGPPIAPALRNALDSGPEVDVQLRIRVILARLEDPVPSGERLRLGRAVQVLELIGEGEARTLLEKLAGGAAEAELTLNARAAVERLSQRVARR